jgi:membrane protease YdiL (CAAX protease family)
MTHFQISSGRFQTKLSVTRSERSQAILRAGLFWVCFFACLLLTRMVIGQLGLAHSPSNIRAQWAGGVLLVVLMLIVTWCFVTSEKRTTIDPGTGFVAGSIPRALAGLVCIAPLAAISVLALKWLVPGVSFVRQQTSVGHLAGVLALYFVLVSYEEIAFRGYPMRRLLPALGTWPTLFSTSVIFAAYHMVLGWGLFQALVGTGAGSVLFGMALLASRRGLAFPIGVHAGWDFVTWCFGVSGAGIWKLSFSDVARGRVQTLGMCSYLICIAIGVLLMWFFRLSKVGQSETSEPASALSQ